MGRGRPGPIWRARANEPMTGPRKSCLQALAREAGQEVDFDGMSKVGVPPDRRAARGLRPRHPEQQLTEKAMTAAGLSLLTLNIGNPSPERARRQLAWLIRRDEHVLVLTETKASAGCRLLAEGFAEAGYAVHWPQAGPGEYGTMIVSVVAATADDGFGDRVGYLPSRAAAVVLPAPGGPLRVIGLYVPARDASIEKTERKRKWLAACDAALAATAGEMPVLLLGDLNVIEPDHRPGYPFFAPFEYDFYRALADPHRLTDAFRRLHPRDAEYSWAGRRGDGYRYDHAFVSDSLSGQVIACDYLHQPRDDGLSDHSALTMHLAIPGPAFLPPGMLEAG